MSSEVKALLISLEEELRRLDCWQGVPPSPEAMASTVPFLYGYNGFHAVVAVVLYILDCRLCRDHGGNLPKGANIKPYAEEALRVERVEAVELLKLVEEFVRLMK